MIILEDRIMLHLQDGRRIPVDPQEIRPVPGGGWEVKLDPPVNRVLPVSRRRVSALWERIDLAQAEGQRGLVVALFDLTTVALNCVHQTGDQFRQGFSAVA